MFFKYIKLLLGFKDVRNIYKEENGADKPGWASRRFIGASVLLIGTILQTLFGVEIDSQTIGNLSDNFSTLAGSAQVVIPAGMQLYGAILAIVGAVKHSK